MRLRRICVKGNLLSLPGWNDSHSRTTTKLFSSLALQILLSCHSELSPIHRLKRLPSSAVIVRPPGLKSGSRDPWEARGVTFCLHIHLRWRFHVELVPRDTTQQ